MSHLFLQYIVGYAFITLILKNHLNIILVGPPIHVKKKKNPSLHQVNRIHKKYISSLKNIFNHHKTKYGENESTPLIID